MLVGVLAFNGERESIVWLLVWLVAVDSCASVADQLSTTHSSTSQQTQSSSTQQSSVTDQQRAQTETTSSSLHAGLSEAAFRRAVSDTAPSADELEKVNTHTHTHTHTSIV